mmetsp:Transcript_25800/g.56567  ORF Transcript_25800/g.56567 Transcript_25800/m.56567 type:complete len:216 (-) Transcript_25800:408-1055(-)
MSKARQERFLVTSLSQDELKAKARCVSGCRYRLRGQEAKELPPEANECRQSRKVPASSVATQTADLSEGLLLPSTEESLCYSGMPHVAQRRLSSLCCCCSSVHNFLAGLPPSARCSASHSALHAASIASRSCRSRSRSPTASISALTRSRYSFSCKKLGAAATAPAVFCRKSSPPFAPGGTGSASSASEAASGGGIALRIARQLNGSSKSSRTSS